MTSFGGSVKLQGENEYRKAIKNITANLREVSSELKLTNTQFANGDKSLKDTRTSYNNMNQTLNEQKTKISELRKALLEAEKEYGKNNEQVRTLRIQLNNAETSLASMEKQTNASNKELKEMKNDTENAGQGALKLGDIIKANLISDAIKSGLLAVKNGIKKVGSALLEIGKSAIQSYADFEQLIGGVETLFKESSDIVKNYANNAYKTAGLSANEYMETVTSFSASLLQSLNGDTAKSAEVADMAITDMADNANKMGTSMESIQTAYQGFAKQNYTMLDNLKLGYGGTKTEMQRLLKDAQKITGIKYDINNLNDVYQAIHVIQGELGITGTTAKEASETISGSTAAMKSAWQNLLTGIADDNADFSGLVKNFVDSVAVSAKNLLPRIQVVAQGIVELVTNLADELLPEALQMGTEIILNLITGIVNSLPDIMTSANEIISTLIQGISSMIPQIGYSAFYIIQELIKTLLSNLPQILQMGIDLLLELVNGISQTLPELIPVIVDSVILIVETLLDNIDLIIDAGINLILALAEGLINALPQLIDKIPIIIDKLIIAITNNLPKILQMGITLIIELAKGLIKAVPQLISKIPEIIVSLVNGFGNFFSNMSEIGRNLIEGIGEGILKAKDWLINKVKELCNNCVDAIKNFFGIHSPSTLMRDEIGSNLALGIGTGFEKEMVNVSKNMQNVIPSEFDISSTITRENINNTNTAVNLKDALLEAFKEFKPVVILDKKEIGEFAFEYGNIKYGSYYN